jgi:hypothetical protein
MKTDELRPSRKTLGYEIANGAGDFCSVADGVTFGVLGGHTFCLMDETKWAPESRIKWAKATILFFEGAIAKLAVYAELTAMENPQPAPRKSVPKTSRESPQSARQTR